MRGDKKEFLGADSEALNGDTSSARIDFERPIADGQNLLLEVQALDADEKGFVHVCEIRFKGAESRE